jgi:uncharacterized protein YgiM (DUF1202 family)
MLISCLFLCLVAGSAQSDTTFPYVAYVAAPQTFARSGPGQQHYPTQQLPQGNAVEVYRHDRDGWCAVRPPEGSFSWIPAHEIHRQSATKAVVAVQTTVARVGSAVSPARNAVQVMLRRDEEVQILPAGPNDDPRWVRIAPPPGEFRWIAAVGLSRTPPVEGANGVQLASGWMRQRSATGVQQVAGEATDAFAHLLQSAPGNPLPTQSSLPTPPSTGQINNDPNAVQVVAGSPAAIEIARSDSFTPPPLLESSTPLPATSSPELRSSTTPRIRFGNSPEVLGPASTRLQELQLRLSQVIVKPKEEWQLEQLQTEATEMLEQTDSVTEREHIRNLLDRIARFQQVQLGAPSSVSKNAIITKDRQPGENFTGMSEQVRELVQTDLGNKDPFEGKAVDPEGPRYDAVGRLKPVVSQSDDSPRFALVDDRGEVVSFVTPTPDLNLRPYVGMLIGVNGSRGFMPEYRKAHVTAGRVMPIEDRVIRR